MKTKNRLFGVEKNAFVIGLTSFFTDTSTKMVYSVMPLFLLSIGASKTTISLIEGSAESTASLLKAFRVAGRIKRKKKPFMMIGYGITAIITPLYAMADFQNSNFYYFFFFETHRKKGIRTAPRDSPISVQISRKGSRRKPWFSKGHGK
jgi:hypothetical protein